MNKRDQLIKITTHLSRYMQAVEDATTPEKEAAVRRLDEECDALVANGYSRAAVWSVVNGGAQ